MRNKEEFIQDGSDVTAIEGNLYKGTLKCGHVLTAMIARNLLYNASIAYPEGIPPEVSDGIANDPDIQGEWVY
jgi:hypothetical protein